LIEAGVDPRYAFQQKLVRDVLYNSLPFARRRELHTRLAEYLVSPTTQRREIHSKVSAFLNAAAVGNPVQDAKVVASHYEAAENWVLAARNMLRAAEHLWNQAAYDEAVETYDRALAYLDNLASAETDSDVRSLKQSLLIGQGNSAFVTGKYSKAVIAFEAAVSVQVNGESADVEGSLTKKLALLLPLQGQANEAENMLRERIGDCEAEQDLATAATLAWLLWREDSSEKTEWIAVSKSLQPSNPDAWSLGIDALLEDFSGQWEQAISKYQSINYPIGTALASIRLGDQYLRDGNISGAQKLYDESQKIFSELSDEECGLALVYYRLAEAAWYDQEINRSRVNLDKAQSIATSCPAVIREEIQSLIISALEIINGDRDASWHEWRWQYFDDVFRIGLLFKR